MGDAQGSASSRGGVGWIPFCRIWKCVGWLPRGQLLDANDDEEHVEGEEDDGDVIEEGRHPGLRQ